jgi:hypothetical protein
MWFQPLHLSSHNRFQNVPFKWGNLRRYVAASRGGAHGGALRVEFIRPIAHNLKPFKPITYSLSTEKLVSKFAFQVRPAALHRGVARGLSPMLSEVLASDELRAALGGGGADVVSVVAAGVSDAAASDRPAGSVGADVDQSGAVGGGDAWALRMALHPRCLNLRNGRGSSPAYQGLGFRVYIPKP